MTRYFCMTRYFVALLPPPAVQAEINQVKQHFADRYHSRKAFNASPISPCSLPSIGPCLHQGKG